MTLREQMPEVIAEWQSGLTLQQIGEKRGVTRERVRQLLRKFEIPREVGGQTLRSKMRETAKVAARDQRYRSKYGLSFAEWHDVPPSLRKAYKSQKRSARNRGLAWSLNLAQWLHIWRTSGRLELRGNGRGKYCMSRINDAGGYVLGNVYITSCGENVREYARRKHAGLKPAHSVYGVGVYLLYPGTSRPYFAKAGKKSLGYFKTAKGARGARARYFARHPKQGLHRA